MRERANFDQNEQRDKFLEVLLCVPYTVRVASFTFRFFSITPQSCIVKKRASALLDALELCTYLASVLKSNDADASRGAAGF